MKMLKKLTLAALVLSLATLTAISCRNGAQAGNKDNTAITTGTENTDFMNEVTVIRDTTMSDGTRAFSVIPSRAVCSVQIDIEVKDGTIRKVRYTGGCSGNTQGVSRLVEGMKITDAIGKLEGIDCGGKGTSCPDQLSKALKLLL